MTTESRQSRVSSPRRKGDNGRQRHAAVATSTGKERELLSRDPFAGDDQQAQLKLKIAEELNLADRVRREGWGALTAAETGRIGGWMRREVLSERRRGHEMSAVERLPENDADAAGSAH